MKVTKRSDKIQTFPMQILLNWFKKKLGPMDSAPKNPSIWPHNLLLMLWGVGTPKVQNRTSFHGYVAANGTKSD